MEAFEFTIIASGPRSERGRIRRSLFFEAGCDDATISCQRGAIILDFTRAAETLPFCGPERHRCRSRCWGERRAH